MRRTAPLVAAALFVVWAGTWSGMPAQAGEAAPGLDLRRFAGTWYELARVPNRVQRHCAGDVTALYVLRRDGRMTVSNRCRRADGGVDTLRGIARTPPGKDGAQLEVNFMPRWLRWTNMGWGDYRVVAHDADYRLAIVSDRAREHLWVLARSPHLDIELQVLAPMMLALQAAGYAVDRLEPTPHFGLMPPRKRGVKVVT